MSKSRLLSGRVKKISGSELDLDRNQFLNLANAEPDLGNPNFDGSILVADIAGNRYWSPSIRADLTGNVFLGSINSADGSSAIRLTFDTIIEGGLTIEGAGSIPNLITSEISSADSSSIVIVNSIIAQSNLDVQNDLTVNGNFTVLGSTTTINSTTFTVEDKNIELAKNSTSAITSDGAGITVLGPDVPASIVYNAETNTWNFNKTIVGTVEGATSVQDIDDRIGSFFDNDINTSDSSSIVFVPGVEMRSDLNVDNDLRVSNTVYATTFIGDGSQLTGILTGSPAILTQNLDLNGYNIAGTGVISATSFVGDGSELTGIIASTGYTGSAGPTGTSIAVSNLYQAGELTVFTGIQRWYAPYNLQITKITARVLETANDDIEIEILKNGILLIGLTIPIGVYTAAVLGNDSILLSMSEGEYITVNVVQVGTGVQPGSDLYLQFTYASK